MLPDEASIILPGLVSLPRETEWVEFKQDYAEPQGIGEYISALANSAALHDRQYGYIVWGIEDGTHTVVGTSFKPHSEKVGAEALLNWLATQLTPRIDVRFQEFEYLGHPIVLVAVPRATHVPVAFRGQEFIRHESYKKRLMDFPEKERELWAVFSRKPFDRGVAAEGVTEDRVLSLLDYPAYFELTGQPLPDNRAGILARLESEQLATAKGGGRYDVTNLGAILFAKRINEFTQLSRKALRVVVYKGTNRVETMRETPGSMGYAVGFQGAIRFISDQLPENEEIGLALRRQVRMYPEIAIRELVANAIIHQDFTLTGTGPMVELFSDRIEITNPGAPLIDTMRFIDEPPRSRNEALAAFMRRLNICEERGSGIDKVVFNVELYQLPAPDFSATSSHTRAVLFAYRKLADMDRADRVRACYQHACLKYVSNDTMTNASLRQRFSIEERNYSMAWRIIRETLNAGLVKRLDPGSKSKKHAKYVPFWA